jgi:hypothetical protein
MLRMALSSLDSRYQRGLPYVKTIIALSALSALSAFVASFVIFTA